QYLKKFGFAKRPKINRLLEEKLSDLLTEPQKRKKIENLLQRLRREGAIIPNGKRQAVVWKLSNQKETSLEVPKSSLETP
ncbi:MAG: hypothetical protein ABIP71_06415, partial [Verrucomicrobiota bacterium]